MQAERTLLFLKAILCEAWIFCSRQMYDKDNQTILAVDMNLLVSMYEEL